METRQKCPWDHDRKGKREKRWFAIAIYARASVRSFRIDDHHSLAGQAVVLPLINLRVPIYHRDRSPLRPRCSLRSRRYASTNRFSTKVSIQKRWGAICGNVTSQPSEKRFNRRWKIYGRIAFRGSRKKEFPRSGDDFVVRGRNESKHRLLRVFGKRAIAELIELVP